MQWKSYHPLIDEAFVEVLLVWLTQNYDVERFGPPTWWRLVEVVDSVDGGNDHALALAIASKHLGCSMCCISKHMNSSAITFGK